jgi:hypothetical protein
MGDNMHIDFNNYSSVSKKSGKIGWSVGAFMGANLDFKTHRPLHKVLEVNGVVYMPSAVLGMSYDVENFTFANKYEWNKFAVGLGFKQISYKSISHEFSIAELIEHKDDMDDYILDDVAKDGSSTAFDLGMVYELTNIMPNLQVGGSILNIGGVGEKDSGYYVPTTVNLGVAYSKRIDGKKFFNQYRVAFDYVDLFNAYADEKDSDTYKRVRFGGEFNVWDGWFSTLALRAGMYQMSPTYGADLRLMFVNLSYAVYEEEIGAYNGQDKDKRQIVNISIGW